MVGVVGEAAHGANGFLVVRQFQRGLNQRLLIEEIGAEEAGLDHRGVDAQRRQFLVQRFGDPLHRELGGAVHAPAHVGLVAADG
ncbi:hypothetical protein D9M68_977270 [compost metagenome]